MLRQQPSQISFGHLRQMLAQKIVETGREILCHGLPSRAAMVAGEVFKGIVKTFETKRLDQKFQACHGDRHLPATELENGLSGRRLEELQYPVAHRQCLGARRHIGKQEPAGLTRIDRPVGHQQLVEAHIPHRRG